MGAALNLTVTALPDSVSVADNTSQVQITVKITTDSGTYNQTGSTLGSVWLDGAKVASLDGKWVYINTTTTLYSAVHTVGHDDDGTKNVTVRAEFNVNTPMTGLRTAQTTLALPRIPRCALLTVPTFTLGQPAALHISDGPAGCQWAVDYTLGTEGGRLVARGTDTQAVWTPPVALAAQFPAAPQGQGTMTITTWSGETEIGSRQVPFTVLTPDSLAPQVTALTVTLTSGRVPQDWHAAVKGRTRLSYAVSAQALEGAGITGCTFTCGGVSAEGLSGTTAALAQAGTFAPRVTVTDSRGKTTVMEGEPITVYDYALPAFTESGAHRADETGSSDGEGSHAAVWAAASFAAVGGHNTLTLRARYRAVGGQWSGYTPLTAGAVTVLTGFALSASYEVEVEAIDALGGSRAVVYSIPTADVAFHLKAGGCGAAFGKYAERDGWLESDWPMDLRGNRLTGLGAAEEAGDAVSLGHLQQALSTAADETTQQLSAVQQELATAQQGLDALQQRLDADTAPDMVPGTEYLTGEKWNGAPVYAMVVDYGTLPNSAEGENFALAANLDVIDIRGFAVGSAYIIPLPGYYAVESMGYTRSTGNLWISTTRDLSGYRAYITVKYTK